MTVLRCSDEIKLAAIRSALSCARMFVLSTLSRWRALSVLGDAVTVTEELVTRAVKATGVMGECLRWSELAHVNLIRVRLLGFDSSVVVEVWDCDPDTPTQPDTAGSRRKCGSYLTGGGKVAWVELSLQPRHHSPDFLRRVRDGLGRL